MDEHRWKGTKELFLLFQLFKQRPFDKLITDAGSPAVCHKLVREKGGIRFEAQIYNSTLELCKKAKVFTVLCTHLSVVCMTLSVASVRLLHSQALTGSIATKTRK